MVYEIDRVLAVSDQQFECPFSFSKLKILNEKRIVVVLLVLVRETAAQSTQLLVALDWDS